MSLAKIVSVFKGLTFSLPEAVVDRPGWLFAQRCSTDIDDDPAKRVTVWFVYRSPLVSDTHSMYEPIARAILAAERLDLLHEFTSEDPNMMYGEGRGLVFGTSAAGFDGPYTAEQAREMLRSYSDAPTKGRLPS